MAPPKSSGRTFVVEYVSRYLKDGYRRVTLGLLARHRNKTITYLDDLGHEVGWIKGKPP
jgi:hypothetical protein